MKLALTALVFLLSISNSLADSNDGNHLLKACQDAVSAYETKAGEPDRFDKVEVGWCYGAVGATAALLYDLGRGTAGVCLPMEYQTGEMITVVIKYLENNPQILHEDYSRLTVKALKDAFPCK